MARLLSPLLVVELPHNLNATRALPVGPLGH